MLASLLLTASLAPTQDGLDRKETERLVGAYLALDQTEPDQVEVGRGLLRDLASAPYPSKRDMRRWEKLFAEALEARLEAAPLGKEEGEYFEEARGRRGRYHLAGETRRPKALFVGLHGGGEGSGDADTSLGAYRGACASRGWLGLFPEVLEKTERGWTDSGTEEWVLSLVDRALWQFDIDPSRVYIGGHSMGGYGTWAIGAHHPDRFAAGVASAGAPSPVYQGGRVVSIQKGIIPNLRSLPLLVFQSTDDPKVPPDANQAAVREIEKARSRYGGYADFTYWEVGDRGHGFPKGGTEALLGRIEGFERDPLPSKVVWQPDLSWKRQFYWLSWDKPKPGALVIAQRTGNTIELDLRRTDGEGLRVLLSGDLVALDEPVVVRVNGSKVFDGMVEPSFATLVETRAHGDAGRAFVAAVRVR